MNKYVENSKVWELYKNRISLGFYHYQPIVEAEEKVNVMIEENIAIFDSQNVDTEEYAREWNRYREELSWLSEKLKLFDNLFMFNV